MKRATICFLFAAASATAEPVQTTVCAVSRAPESFDGQFVQMRATIVSGFEIFGVRDPQSADCGTIWLTYAGGGPTASTSFAGSTPDIDRSAVHLREDGAMKQMTDLLNAEMYPRDRGTISAGCHRYEVTATLTGRIDSAGKGRGFGHLNGFAAQLVLESVSDVSPKDLASTYDAKEYSATPIRFPTAYLRGQVLSPEGKPVVLMEVTAESTRKVPLYMADFTEWTDERGEFAFEVPPGSYRIAINRSTPASPKLPYATTFFPAAADARSAKTIRVSDRQHVDDLLIRIPESLHPRTVPVKVTWPDGKPVEEANVWLSEVHNPHAVVGSSVSHTDANGLFDLIGFEGIDYKIRANIYVKPSYKPYCAGGMTVKAADAIAERLVFVLTKTGDVCRSTD